MIIYALIKLFYINNSKIIINNKLKELISLNNKKNIKINILYIIIIKLDN